VIGRSWYPKDRAKGKEQKNYQSDI
jgi:hypothetical protein